MQISGCLHGSVGLEAFSARKSRCGTGWSSETASVLFSVIQKERKKEEKKATWNVLAFRAAAFAYSCEGKAFGLCFAAGVLAVTKTRRCTREGCCFAEQMEDAH